MSAMSLVRHTIRAALVAAAALAMAMPAARAQNATATDVPPIDLPGIKAYAPARDAGPQALRSGRLTLKASLVQGSDPIPRGMTWRVFLTTTGDDGRLPLVASAQGGDASFDLAPGAYLVHAAFGRAGATKRVTIKPGETRAETVVLDAGGLKLNATLSGGVRIPPQKLKFSIYDVHEDVNGEHALIIPDVKPGTVVRLNAGTYHIVSTYGAVNAVIRSDIRVEAGKLTEAVVEHRAAQLTLKLVRDHGGEAIADTSWAVMTEAGDIVRENVGAFASMVLAEGNYVIVAKNRDHIYQRDFTVVAGKNQDVEVLAD
ncbi:hypothetical protein [Zhengella mangrovi]|nr:hypothetical protein [Zhengella mangrovi]